MLYIHIARWVPTSGGAASTGVSGGGIAVASYKFIGAKAGATALYIAITCWRPWAWCAVGAGVGGAGSAGVIH